MISFHKSEFCLAIRIATIISPVRLTEGPRPHHEEFGEPFFTNQNLNMVAGFNGR